MNDNRDTTKFPTYAELCKRRASGETADALEFIRGERAFDEPEVRVVQGERQKWHLRGRSKHKSKMRSINMYKDYDKLSRELHRE